MQNFLMQVRIRLLQKCPNLPISVFKVAIIDNFYDKWKFRYGLNEAQVKLHGHQSNDCFFFSTGDDFSMSFLLLAGAGFDRAV